MRRLFVSAFALCLLFTSFAQDTKTTNTKWKNGAVLTLMGGQSGTRNWTAAPEKFSITGITSLYIWANKTSGKTTWDNSLDLAYAVIKTESSGLKKIDDKIDLYSRYSYQILPKMGIGLVSNLRTQFSNGYDESESLKKRISGFFAPAFLVFSPGVHFKPVKDISVAIGPAARWVIVSNSPYSYTYQGGITPEGGQQKTVAEIYGVNPQKQSRFEYGLFLSALYNKEVAKNVMYKTRLDAMSNFAESTPGNIDIYWTNGLVMSINKWLKVAYNFDLIYDDDIRIFGDNKNTAATQMKSILGVGLAVKL